MRRQPPRQATSLERFLAVLDEPQYHNTLWVTHASRKDIILGLPAPNVLGPPKSPAS